MSEKLISFLFLVSIFMFSVFLFFSAKAIGDRVCEYQEIDGVVCKLVKTEKGINCLEYVPKK